MISRRDFGVVALSLISGFGGGMLSIRSQPVIAGSQEPVRASRFELVDGSGKTIAFWGMDSHQCTSLAFTGGTKNEVAVLGLSGFNAFLHLNGADGKPRARLQVGWHEKPFLNLGDEVWQGRVSLGFIAGDAPGPEDDTWGLVFGAPPADRGHRVRAAIGYSKSPSGRGWDGSVALEDSKGKIWKAP